MRWTLLYFAFIFLSITFQLLEEAGFSNVKAEDRTQQFINILRTEVTEFEQQESDFLRDFSQSDYDEIVAGWHAKTRRCQAGDQAWGMFLAEKKWFISDMRI